MRINQQSNEQIQTGGRGCGARSKAHSQAALLAAASSAILAIGLLSPAPALAACTPEAGNNVSVACTGASENLNGDNGYGTGAETGVTLTLDPGATLTGDDYGVSLGENARVTTGTGSLVKGVEGGIKVDGGDAVISVAGRVESEWIGIKIGSGSVTLAEGGSIAVSNPALTDDDVGAGIMVLDDGAVTIDGSITTSGRLVQGVFVERWTPNSGRATEITVGQTGAITTDGEYASAIGLFGGENSNVSHRVTVHGALTTTGDHAYGIDVREVLDAEPIRADTTVVMNGVLRTSGREAHGIFSSVSDGSLSSITVSNDLRVTGEDAHGVVLGIARDGAGQITVTGGGTIMGQGLNGMGIALGPSGEHPGLGTANIVIEEGGRVFAGSAPAIGVFDDPAMPVDPAIGRINVDLTIAGRVVHTSASETVVLLGAGDDRVTLLPTYDVKGVIDGGDGFDTFVLDGAAGTVGEVELVLSNTARVTGFEDIRKVGDGTWRISGTVPSWMVLPAGTVEAGTVVLDAAADSLDLTVQSGATLAGGGSLRNVAISNGGILAPGNSPGVLSMASLTLNNGSLLDFELGAPGVAAASDRIDVSGGLTLDGILNVTDAGGFGNGVYTLINYGTLVADNGLTVGTAPAGHAYTVNAGTGTASAVTLEVATEASGANQYWDGTNSAHGNTQYGRGGAGVWNAANSNWTNAGGTANAAWGDQFAIFYNGTGDVTVEGEQNVTGLQFAADGYRLVAGAGGALNLTGASSSVRVDAGSTARLALPVTVAGHLTKDGGGTLSLSGATDVSGDLRASDGVLRVEDGGAMDVQRGYVTNGASLVVDGAGSVLTAQDTGPALIIGDTSDGTLRILAGGKVEGGASIGRLAYIADGQAQPYKGVAEISGTGSVWNAGTLLVGAEGGDGALTISDGAVVNGENGWIGIGYLPSPADAGIPGRDSTGRATIHGAGSAWRLSDAVGLGVGAAAGNGSGVLTVAAGGELRSKTLYLGSGTDTFGDLRITGAGSTVTADSGIFVGYGGRGDLTISDGGQASGFRGEIATRANGVGNVLVTGAGSAWTVGDLIEIGTNGGVGSLTIADGGLVRTGAELADGFAGINLGGNAASSATLNIGAAPGAAPVAAGVLDAAYVSFSGSNGTLNFNHSGATTFAPVIDSLAGVNHAINHYAGTTIITGDPAIHSGFKGFTGTTTVHGGTLLVGGADGKGELGGLVIVKSGATLGGSGIIGKNGPKVNNTAVHNVIEAGGIVAPGTNGVGSLTFAGGLRFEAGSQLHIQIGAPGSADSPGTSDRLIMADLNSHLDIGARPELHLFDDGGAGIGHYRIITMNNAAGTFSPSGDYFTIVQPRPVPDADYRVVNTWEPGGTNNHFDLVIGTPDNLQYWQDNSAIWNTAGLDWRNSGEEVDVAWAGNHGVFNGAGSAIAVDGTQSLKGLQFVPSGYTLGGAGTLQTVAGGSELRVLGDETATIAATIGGSGGITKTQGGTLILSGINSYTGQTIVEAGTLALRGAGAIEASSGVNIGGAGTFDVGEVTSGAARIGSLSGAGTVSLGATDLHLTQTQAATFDGYMTGTGDFTLSGPATLAVTGIVGVGLTSISAGSTLQIGSGVAGQGGQVSNDIHNAGTLVINRGDTGSWDGVLTGSGHLINRGPGTTIFAGNSSLYTGAVDLEAGMFRLAESGVLGTSLLSVGNGATLSGTGRVMGDVFVGSGGRFAPGNSIGTFNVAGDVTFAAGSIYDVEIAANGDADRIAATGSATLQGGTVQVTALDPHISYLDGQHYTIISADAGVTGTFDDVTMLNHSAFITPTLEHDSHAVLLSIAVVREFDTAAETFNQREAARGLFSFDQTSGSDALAVFNSIAGLNAQDARYAFDLSSGEIHASSHYAIADAADLFTRTIQRRAGSMPAVSGRTAPWLAFLGQSGRHDADGNAARLSSRSYGLAAGIDLVNGDLGGKGAVRFGLAAGYLDGRATVDGRRSEVDYDSTLVGAYLTLSQGPLHLSNAFSLGWHDLDTERRMTWGTLERTANASRKAQTVGYSASLRYDVPVGGLRLSPLATLDIANVQFKAARETGAGALDLTLVRENFTAASVGAGAEVGFGTQAFSGSVRVLYDHQIGDALPRQRAAFAGGSQDYSVLGPKMRDGGVSAGAAFAYRLSDRATITASYDGAFNSDANNHKGSIALNIGF
ncbi:MAG: hypothetical protein CVT74_03900 [Alphaproteobacteria bacterium HGW-Alphaproteobacteria-13]|nr:MAG: hypothetical protein CVT74_03900 [Alphaproteobacteria bacterium HGW-Alphaproteobacteria-13]